MAYLLEKLKGERTPDVSLAAHPKIFTGCSVSGDFAIYLFRERENEILEREKEISERENNRKCGN